MRGERLCANSSQNLCSPTLIIKEDLNNKLLWLALLGVTWEQGYVLGLEQSL